jgi:hypothetical protein
MITCPEAGTSASFLGEQRRLLEQAEESGLVPGHESFLRRLAAQPAGCFRDLDPDFLEEHQRFFRARHLRYLLHTEELSCQQALHAPEVTLAAILERVFGAGAALWQRELGRVLGEGRHSRLVMVGSGPLPATLLWLAHRHPTLECLGLDSNAAALCVGARLAHKLGASSLHFAAVDGVDYDYAGADLVYVANQVAPKRRVLERILATADRAVTVIVRDPCANGCVLADPVLDELPEGYVLERTGAESPLYLSRDLVLRLDVATGSRER